MTNNIQSAAVSDRGLSEKRPHNEDSYLEMNSRGLFAVADGVGGAQAGEVASQMAMEILQEAFTNLPPGGDVEDMMRAAIDQANASIFQMSHDLPQLSSMATTIVALHIDGNIATIGHVGDSRLYRIDSKGNLFRETNDHSVVEEEVRAGRMTPAQAANHPSRNIISRALGAENTVQIDMKTIMFEPHTTFLLCSDGITRHIEDHELRQLLNSSDPVEKVCDDMKHICYGRGAEDNLTAVIVRIAEVTSENLADEEEQTMAAVRAPLSGSGVFAIAGTGGGATPFNDSADISTQGLQMPETVPTKIDDFETRENSDSSQIITSPDGDGRSLSSDENFSNGNTIPVETETTTETPLTEPVEPVAAEKSYIVDESEKTEKARNGGLFIPLLLGLLLGAALGAAGYHFWRQSQPQIANAPVQQEAPKITQMQTANIPFSAFENNRRNVDNNPEEFIRTNGQTAKDAEDYYLLGRANLVTGNYVGAKENFTKAQELAVQDNAGSDKATLRNEIKFGLSIVDSQYSRRFLEATRNSANQQQIQNNDANTAADTEIMPLNDQTNTNAPVQ
jgi:serine/threonine protein phosphatase PrpC